MKLKNSFILQDVAGDTVALPTSGDKLKAAKMKQSMARVAKCIDNGPMEGFWGILKRERYYGRWFTSREELVQTIDNYITCYNSAVYSAISGF